MAQGITVVTDREFDRAEIIDLYDSVGWSAYTRDPDILMAGLIGSSHVVTARDGRTLVGLARVVSDGATIAYLQDVLVRPSHHRRGIGATLVRAVMAPYLQVRQQILLTDDDPGQHRFYASLGYREINSLPDTPLHTFLRMPS